MPTHFTLPPRALADAVDLRDLVRLGQVNGLVEQRVPNSAINAPNGVAPLDGDGLVPAADLRFGTTAGTVARGEHLHDARYGRGVVGRFRRTTNATASSSTTPVPVLRTTAPIVAGRLYRITSPILMLAVTATATAYALGVVTVRATTDGSLPSQSSPLVAQSHIPVLSGQPAFQPVSGFVEDLYPATVTGTLTLMLSYYRGAGAQGVQLMYADAYPIDLVITDVGLDPGASGTSL